MSIGATIDEIAVSARRKAAVGALLETFDGKDAQLRFVLDFLAIGAITPETADLLAEAYGLEPIP